MRPEDYYKKPPTRSQMAREICSALQLYESRPFFLHGKKPESVRPYLTRESIRTKIRLATSVIDGGRSLLVTRIK